MREFGTGASRASDSGKFDYEGFLDPLVLEAFAAYMDVNRITEDGTQRASDNWQLGIPMPVYAKSEWRHHIDFHKINRGIAVKEGELGAVGGILFNVLGWMHERIKENPNWLQEQLVIYRQYRADELEARRREKQRQIEENDHP